MDETDEFSSFASFPNDGWSFPEEDTKHEFESWDADFRSFEENNSTTSTINKSDCVTSVPVFKELLGKCFECKIESFERWKDSPTTLPHSYKSSLLSSSLQSQMLDPIKPKETCAYQSMLEQIQLVLDLKKKREDWLIKVSVAPIGTFRNDFDFHVLSKNNKKASQKVTRRSNENVKKPSNESEKHCYPVSNEFNIVQIDKQEKPYSEDEKPIVSSGELLVDDGDIRIPLSISSLTNSEFSIKSSLEELTFKPVEELESIASELEAQAKIYSELLLSELDRRDDLQRQQEVMNSFISSHVAVEQKMSQSNARKKSRYGFFKYSEENKDVDLTIPYFSQDGRPTTTELGLMTEILKAIEKEDPETPKLISDYVFKLGNRFDLDTVIKVRTSAGVTPIKNHGKN